MSDLLTQAADLLRDAGHPLHADAVADLATLALAAHRTQCRACRVETCPTGEYLEQAARPSQDIPAYPSL